MMTPNVARALGRLLFLVLAAIVVSWLAVLALMVLSIVWPANQVPHVLLGAWLCLIAAYLVPPLLPGRRLGPTDNWPKRIAYAPLVGPILWIEVGVRRTGSRIQGRPGAE
jgi:hypothetical protein